MYTFYDLFFHLLYVCTMTYIANTVFSCHYTLILTILSHSIPPVTMVCTLWIIAVAEGVVAVRGVN